jgi:hypothetical protein
LKKPLPCDDSHNVPLHCPFPSALCPHILSAAILVPNWRPEHKTGFAWVISSLGKCGAEKAEVSPPAYLNKEVFWHWLPGKSGKAFHMVRENRFLLQGNFVECARNK